MNQKVFVELKICRGCLNCNTKLIEPDEDILKNFNFLLNSEVNDFYARIFLCSIYYKIFKNFILAK